MYLDHFGLKSDPFRLDPNLDFVYVSQSHEETLAHLVYGIEQGEDFVLITGGIGTGKTLALHFLLDQIVSSYRTAFINVTTVSFLELLKLILDDLEVDFGRDWDRADLLATLKHYLEATRRNREKVLIVVDEAQNLKPETLEGLRLLSNLSQPGEQVLQIILVGQPTLMRLIDLPNLEQLKQRIRVHYQLEALTPKEVGEYLKHRMTVSGGDGSVFSKEAIERINKFSGGIPRLVNQFAGKALLSAFVEESSTVKGFHVELEEGETEDAPEVVQEVEEPQPDPEPLPQAPKRVLKSSLPKAASDPSQPRETRPAKRKKSGKKQKPLVEEALTSIEDVDLDAIRDSRNPETASRKARNVPRKKSGSGKALIWAACLVVVVGAALYFTGGWTWLTENLMQADQPNRPALAADSTPERSGDDDLATLGTATPDDQPTETHSSPALVAGQAAGESENSRADLTSQPAVSARDTMETVLQSAEEETAEPIPEPTPAEPQVLHVASFRSPAQANSLVSRLKGQGVEVFVQDQVVNGTTWYRVYLGPFPDVETAIRVGEDLKSQRAVMYYRLVESDR